jgi:CelD/BcsL family acetyltransferase involved in cellulose biosynthesis
LNPSSVRIEIARDSFVFDRIKSAYPSLLEQADWINPYFSPAWLDCWWKRQSKTRLPFILLAYSEDDDLLGYWPFVERPGLLGSKGLWPFVYDEANYHFPTCTKEVVPLFVDKLNQLLGSFLFTWIPQVPAAFWDEHLSLRVEEGRHFYITRDQRKSSLVIPESGQSFEDYWQSKMGSKSRKSFRYDQRALGDQGEVSFETCTEFKDVRSIMPATCQVEVESGKTLENAGLYTIRGKRAFFFELLPELAKSEQVRISMLRVDDHPIAWQLELLQRGKSYLHHLAYDENWKKYSPGKQLLHNCLERCWKEERTVDFLPAPFAYKEKYATSSEVAHELHWIKKSIRGRIARRLITWNMKVRQKMRERSPGLAAAVAREQVTRANTDS